MKTEIKNSAELNAGGLVGSLVVNFHPNVTFNFGLKKRTARQKNHGNLKKTEVSTPNVTGDETTQIPWKAELYHIARPGTDKLYVLELHSERDLIIAIQESSEKEVEPSPLIANDISFSRDKYGITFNFVEQFSTALLSDPNISMGSIQYPSNIEIFEVIIESSKYGVERFILLPSPLPSGETKSIDDLASDPVVGSIQKEKQKELPDRDQNERSLTIEQEISQNLTESRSYFLEWPPQKLGEGAFGAVYLGRDSNNRPVAIKILYSRQFSTGTGLISISHEDLAKMSSGFSTRRPRKNDNSDSSELSHLSPLYLILMIIDGIEEKSNNVKDGLSNDDFETIKNMVQEIIRRSSVGSELSKARFIHEATIDQDIRSTLEDLGIRAADKYVKVIDSTEMFHKSNAFKALSDYHEFMGSGNSLNYSGFAIVMEYFDHTLKDLLEEQHLPEITPEVSRLMDSESIREKVGNLEHDKLLGYDLLRCLSFEERAMISLPHLKGVADSLVEIHLAGRMHHDIKPGNVFVKQQGNRLDVRLGDFSFVGKLENPGSNEAELRDFIGIGEMHYRSPEQDDFVEVMQAEISHSVESHTYLSDVEPKPPAFVEKNIGEQKVFFLRVRDPKFKETLIGKDDKFVLSSDQEGAVYPIDYVRESESHLDIWTQVDSERLREKFLPTKKAQVTFFKIPTRKTDLFGLGGLAYELLTAGGSPSRFYERLRAVDQVGSTHTVDSLVAAYEGKRFGNGGGVFDASVRNLFSAFIATDSAEYAPDWTVEFILRCMSFNLKGSYFEKYSSDSGNPEFGRMSKNGEYRFAEVCAASAFLDTLGTDLKIDRNTENFLLNPMRSSYWPKIMSVLSGGGGKELASAESGESMIERIRRYVTN
jgi:serine/threonine protein kinase